MSGPGFDPCGGDPELVFELADGGLDGESSAELRHHLEHCSGCRELYERELNLNSYLGSLELSEPRPCSVSRVVAMALPTRSIVARFLWATLAGALLLSALVSLELNGTGPVMLVVSVLAACWGFISGSADVVRAVFAAAGSTLLLVLALGALADLFIALAFVPVVRGRRAREA